MLKRQTEILIIGGGAVGCSIAYHLAKMGKTDVALLEKSALTHGATWHAAGLVGQLRSKRNLTRLMQYSTGLYQALASDTGQDPGWRPVGSLRLASSEARWREIKQTATIARGFGFELELISASEARERFPLMNTRGVRGAAWIPSDGYVDPTGLTHAYAKGARGCGVSIVEGETVVELVIRERRIVEVITDRSCWQVDVVVNAAGLWAKQIAALAGCRVPAGVVEHQYLVTEQAPEVSTGLPTFRDPDKLFYLKAEAGMLSVGGWEPDTRAFAADGMPAGFGRELLPSDFDRFEQIATKTAERLPLMREVGVRTLINGPIPVSADGEPIMGPAPELDNFFVACGFTAGIAASGGAGKTMAEWIVHGEPEYDLWNFDLRRFGPHHSGRAFLSRRSVECYGRYYSIHWPNEEMGSARGLRRSPLYETLRDAGAVYGSKFGWERPNWFGCVGPAPEVDSHAFDRSETNWFAAVSAEHEHVRGSVAVIDQSSFAKLVVEGDDALAGLQWLCAANVDGPVGSVVYTQLCNVRGGIECDLTVLRTGRQAFYVVTGSGFGVHDFAWIRKGLRAFRNVHLREVTAEFSVINLCGPKSREVLASAVGEPVGDDVLPFARSRSIEIQGAPVLAARIGYVGELGYELHVAGDYAAHVYDALWQAGQGLGIRNAGYRAIDSLRMEKGYLYWSADITPDFSPFEVGLSTRVHFAAKGDFQGREALEKLRDKGVSRRLCTFTIDGPPVFYGSECILRDGRPVGMTTSANYGFTIKKNIAYGYLPIEYAQEEVFEIEAFGDRYRAMRCDGPLYDPEMRRLRG